MKCFLAVLVLLILGCSPNQPEPPSNESVSAWFENNLLLFIELQEIGIKHPALKRLRADRAEISSYSSLTPEDELAAKRTSLVLRELQAPHVSFSRSYPEFTDLSFVTIPYYSWGLSLGGYSVSIEYINDPSVIEKIKANGHKMTFIKLSQDNWYIRKSDTR